MTIEPGGPPDGFSGVAAEVGDEQDEFPSVHLLAYLPLALLGRLLRENGSPCCRPSANRALIERYEEHSPVRTPRYAGVVAAPAKSRGRYTFVSDESVRPFPRSRILDHGGDLPRRSTGNAGSQLDCPCSAPLIPQLSPSELPLCPFDC